MTKREALFLAIGELDDTQLQRSEMTVCIPSDTMEEPIMFQKSINSRRLITRILVAVLALSLMTATTLAAIGIPVVENARELISTLFDNTEQTDLTPLVEGVGQSIHHGGFTLTAEANLYDTSTNCGILTYSIENPDGLPEYEVQPNGQIYFPHGNLLAANQYGKSIILEEKCTDTRLSAAYYYQVSNPKTTDLILRLSLWVFGEAGGKSSPVSIVIPARNSEGLETVSFDDGTAILSPFALQLDLSKLIEPYDYVKEITFLFDDGTEWTIKDENTHDYIFAASYEDTTDSIYMLNRLVDVNSIAAIVIDGKTFVK